MSAWNRQRGRHARRRRRVTFVLVALIVTVNLVLVARILGRDFPEPLRAGLTDLTWEGDDAVIVPTIYNDGAVPIELLAVSVTGVDDWRVVRSGDDQIYDPRSRTSDRRRQRSSLATSSGR